MHYLRTLVTNGDNELFFLQQCPLPLDTQFFCVCVCEPAAYSLSM